MPNSPLTFNGSEGEREVFEALRLLSNDVYVFHSLRWIGNPSRGRRCAQGEADFVVFDPRRGILVIEVKGGIIEVEDRRWFQTNRATGVRGKFGSSEESVGRPRHRGAAEVPRHDTALQGKLATLGAARPWTAVPRHGFEPMWASQRLGPGPRGRAVDGGPTFRTSPDTSKRSAACDVEQPS
ncbi:nuclease-related domain-containing protein [Enhygromyxa salina]|uniref:nuclease-related domain-containing protein n=1 Tax=Enhygromyxa salina TaxID=215803 RepID=UPI003B8A5B76